MHLFLQQLALMAVPRNKKVVNTEKTHRVELTLERVGGGGRGMKTRRKE
jgi:hypothetical protein